MNFSNSVHLFETDIDLIAVKEYQEELEEFRTIYMQGFNAYVKGGNE